MDRKKVLELDKICRVCISERKDMRPLFSEKVAEMLMECTSVTIEPTEGWPDKICVQCVHSVSRCHAFKTLVERSDKELREYVQSLTVRVVIEDPQELKMQQLQQKQAKLLQLQQQQQALLAQQQEQRKLQHQFERQPKQQKIVKKHLQQQQTHKERQEEKRKLQQQQKHVQEQKQHKLLQDQQQQQQKQQFQQQTHQQKQIQQKIQQKKILARKIPRVTKKQPAQQNFQQQHHQQNAEPVALHSVVSTNSPILATSRQQPQLLPTTAALPQQIVLPNGHVITTAQIVTHSGSTQIAQIYNSTTPSAQSLQQLAPQLIQTTSGQTLQLIQQSNGQPALQLVQLVPQQQRQAAIVDLSDINDQHATSSLMEQHAVEHHLVDAEELEEDVTQLDCDAIVIKEEGLHTQHLLASVGENDNEQLSQADTQEFEYLEDITVTTTAPQHLEDDIGDEDGNQQRHHQQHLLSGNGEDDDIIEEVHMQEEMLEDVEADNECEQHRDMHVIEADEDVVFEQHLMDEDLQYTVIEYSDEIADASEKVEQKILQVYSDSCALDHNASMTSNISACKVDDNSSNNDSSYKKSTMQKSRDFASATTTRQLIDTASLIATAVTDDEFRLDQKFIAEFISQQTTSLGAGRYVCNLCRQEFKQFKGLQNHMYSHSNWIRANCKKQPQCEICFKSFKGPGMLKMHMKTHQSAAKAPVCNICQKTFKSKAILYRHRQTHQLRLYSCGIGTCRKTFSTHSNLRMHMTIKHLNVSQPKYKCGECAMLFDDVDILHAHVQFSGHGVNKTDTENVACRATISSHNVDEEVLNLQSGQQVKLNDVAMVPQA